MVSRPDNLIQALLMTPTRLLLQLPRPQFSSPTGLGTCFKTIMTYPATWFPRCMFLQSTGGTRAAARHIASQSSDKRMKGIIAQQLAGHHRNDATAFIRLPSRLHTMQIKGHLCRQLPTTQTRISSRTSPVNGKEYNR
jgi:hypothetical protein